MFNRGPDKEVQMLNVNTESVKSTDAVEPILFIGMCLYKCIIFM